MPNIFLNNIDKVHFVGIGGISMSGLAEILRSKGFIVSGSDAKRSELTDHLQGLGIEITIGQKYENIKPDCQLVVFTAAVKADNPEIMAAKDLGIKTIDRAELLGAIMKDYEYSVAVSGTHGKTTTTSMISEILLSAGYDPTINVGGIFTTIGSNFRIGSSPYFVAESCEYFDSFLKFFPYIGVILNVEHDHTDYFKNMDQLENSFHRFAANITGSGVLVIHKNIKNFDKLVESLSCQVVTFGDGGDFTAENIEHSADGIPSFDVYHKGRFKQRIQLNMSGLHNVENALAAYACCHFLEVGGEAIAHALSHFSGAKRRFEFKGEFNGVQVIDDYAHHPTAIAATLAGAKKHSHHKIYCAFQPHTYTRTKAFLDRFAGSFTDADVVIILDIYSAREKDDLGVHSKQLVEKISALGKEVYYFENFNAAEKFLLDKCIPNDLLITMGAGDIHLLGENILLTALSTVSTDFNNKARFTCAQNIVR